MNSEEIMALFRKTDAFLDGHFLLSSGLHSPHYFQCAKVLQFPDLARALCDQLARAFSGKKLDLVISPALGGIVVGHEIARSLGCRAIFAEREQGVMKLRRGFEIKPGELVLVVEDVVTTGGSVREVIDLVKHLKGEIKGVGFIVDRSGGKVKFDVPMESLLQLDVITYPSAQCPFCQQGIPVIKPGSRGA